MKITLFKKDLPIKIVFNWSGGYIIDERAGSVCLYSSSGEDSDILKNLGNIFDNIHYISSDLSKGVININEYLIQVENDDV